MKFHIRTLGCKMNWLDAARVRAALEQAGHDEAARESEADLVLVNSCTVTGEADRKSRKEARRILRGGTPLAVMGCGPRVDIGEWRNALPDAAVFDSEEALYAHLQIQPEESDPVLVSRNRVPVAIQTGCDNRCTFCITRVARGPHRSLPLEQVVRQVQSAVDQEVHEVVLTGINLAAWGAADSNLAEKTRLPQLLEALLTRTGIARIRISSMGPQYLTPAFFDLYADERLCDHLHLSVQSGSRSVLRRMDRGHGCEEILRCAEAARARRPHSAITADMIVGFPGESDLEFEETLAFSRDVAFAKLHVFPFSPREGTPAASLPDPVDRGVARERCARLRELSRDLRQRFIDSQRQREVEVVAESDATGITSNYIRLRVPGVAEGSVVRTRIDSLTLAE